MNMDARRSREYPEIALGSFGCLSRFRHEKSPPKRDGFNQ